MSYGVDTAFKKINSIQEMQQFITELKQKAADTKIIKEIVDKNKMYLCYRLGIDKIAQDNAWCDDKLKAKITKIFTFKWCYIDTLNDEPFGYIIMFGVPSALHPLFDGVVYFQNSTDQDYNKEDYDGIPELEAIYDKIKEKELKDKPDKDIYDIETKIYNIIAKPIEDLLYEEKTQTYIALFNETDDMLTIANYVRATVSVYEEM